MARINKIKTNYLQFVYWSGFVIPISELRIFNPIYKFKALALNTKSATMGYFVDGIVGLEIPSSKGRDYKSRPIDCNW